ncbi:hypothetical protein ACH5RR_031182 [Cinchona calisaya]|uniref:Uncharacterized protein n=1 Tax=Cinchona calisaya TaxID=153742 RepID=A0ABD2YHY4_9GENT
MDWRNTNEWQHFLFLLEASGDSEGNPNSLGNPETNIFISSNIIWMNILGGLPLASDDQDDAESSSCDDSNYAMMINSNESREFDGQDFGESNDAGNESPEGLVSSKEVQQKSRIGTSTESISRELDEEIEGDKLFWETCLAAGFP